MIDELIKYLTKLKIKEDLSKLNIDYLNDKPQNYAIEPIPVEPLIRPYTDGGGLYQYVFQFANTTFFNAEVIQNLENNKFYERLQKVIEENNKKGILPKINGIQSIECLNYGTIQNEETDKAKYSIQMRITYYKED